MNLSPLFSSQALYNQYIHFKETEIPAKEQEKGQIEELYKLLEVRIILPGRWECCALFSKAELGSVQVYFGVKWGINGAASRSGAVTPSQLKAEVGNAFLLMSLPGLDRIWTYQVAPGLPPQRCGGGVGQADHRDAGAREAPAAGGGEVGAVPMSPAPSSAHRDPQTPSLTSLCHCRLELLLQIANKIQNGALSCEEKLTLAKNTLQAVSGGWGFFSFWFY